MLETFVPLLIAWVNEGGNIENYSKSKNLGQFASSSEERIVVEKFVLEI